MRIYAESLSKKIALNLPHQMVAMAVEWSRGVESLLGAYFSKPLIIIADKLEASVYKQVKQYVEICSLHDRTDDVMSKCCKFSPVCHFCMGFGKRGSSHYIKNCQDYLCVFFVFPSSPLSCRFSIFSLLPFAFLTGYRLSPSCFQQPHFGL